MQVNCPKCGRDVEDGAFICPGCDYILDASFLGDDITDDERDERPVQKEITGRRRSAPEPRPDFGEDAMILGDVNNLSSEVSSFKSRDAGVSQREVTQARFYIGGAVAQLMEADAIPEIAPGVSGASIRMTPFERHVLTFVNGKRSVGRIQKKSAMDESEYKTALAMLADKGFIRLRGYKKKRPSSSSLSHASGTSTGTAAAPAKPSSPPAPPAAERTVVASMEHIEAMARANQGRGDRAPSAVGTLPAEGSSKSARTVAKSSEVNPEQERPPSNEAQETRVGPSPGSRSRGSKIPRLATPSPEAHDPGDDGEDKTRSLVPPQLRSLALPSDDGPGGKEPPSEHADADDLAVAQAEVASWDVSSNQSSVFAEGRPTVSLVDGPVEDAPPAIPDEEDAFAPTKPREAVETGGAPRGRAPMPKTAALAEAFGDVDDADDFAADDFENPGPTRALDALRDPTGIGDEVVGSTPEASHGAPIIDEDADEGDDEAFDDDEPDDDNLPVMASAEVAAAPDDGFFDPDVDDVDDEDDEDDDDDDDDGVEQADFVDDDNPDDLDEPLVGLPSRRIHSELTGPPTKPPANDAADVAAKVDHPSPNAEDFEPEQRTGLMPSARPMTLPSDALMPAEPPPPLRRPLAATRAVSIADDPKPAPVQTVGLPGQNLVTAATAKKVDVVLPALPVRPATRVSASSQVSFELRKKAERIYEQAIKDHEEGRLSSAMMNAKLAMNFDPTVDAYKELYEALSQSKQEKKVVGGARAQELVLFEQASEAEGRGDYNKAVTLLEQAIEISPRAAALRNRLGVVLSIRLKRHEEALVHLKKAIELEPGSIVYMNNYSKVTGLLESVIEKGPDKKKKGKGGDRVDVRKVRPKMF